MAPPPLADFASCAWDRGHVGESSAAAFRLRRNGLPDLISVYNALGDQPANQRAIVGMLAGFLLAEQPAAGR
jgi:hypothetical protein